MEGALTAEPCCGMRFLDSPSADGSLGMTNSWIGMTNS